MNCVPGFVKGLGIPGVFVCSWVLLQGLKRLDAEIAACDERKLFRYWFGFSTFVSMAVLVRMQGTGMGEFAGLFLLSVYLVICTTLDLLLCQVNDCMQYLGLCGGILCICANAPDVNTGCSLVFFVLLQYGIFMRMYGKADGMAFSVCALYFAGMGGEIEVYLFHMLLCFFLLAIIQLCKRNVSLQGKLKKSVALYPYITVSFFLLAP